MRQFKPNKGLWDKKRFAWLEKEKREWLKNLSMKKAIRLEESLISSSFIWEWRKNFSEDNPICIKDSLKRKS